MTLEHINPPDMHSNPAYSQAVVAQGPGKLIVVGGQNAVDAKGELVGKDLYTQSKQALGNVIKALKASGASQADVMRLAIYIKAGTDVREGFKAAQEVWGKTPTAITVLTTADFAMPGVLVEIEAMAFVAD